MNSTMRDERLAPFFNAVGRENVKRFAQEALAYREALKQGNQELIKARYTALLSLVQRKENESGIKILESPDGGFFSALTAFSGIFCQTAVAEAKRQAPESAVAETNRQVSERKTAVFGTVYNANQWLNYNNTIEIKSVNVSTRTTFGFFANHSSAARIVIEYIDHKRPTGYIYGMCEEERTRFFTRADPEGMKREWSQRNPGLQAVSITTTSNARGSAGSLVLGFGDRIEHIKLFIVYRRHVGGYLNGNQQQN